MVLITVGFVAFMLFMIFVAAWGVHRFQTVSAERGANLAATADSARIDAQALRDLPELASTMADVRWRRLRKENDGRSVVGGVLLFGPHRITWAPDDRARDWGLGPFQIPWGSVVGADVQVAPGESRATVVLRLAGGDLTLTGVDPGRAERAFDARSFPGGARRDGLPDGADEAGGEAGSGAGGGWPAERPSQPTSGTGLDDAPPASFI